MPRSCSAISRRPDISLGILVVGAAIYALLCLPAIGRRGYPPIAPVWMAVTYLWVAPLLLSSLFDSWKFVSRRWHLMAYALFTTFINAATLGGIVPRYVTFLGSLILTIFLFGPLHLVITAAIELAMQSVLRFGRTLSDQGSAIWSTPRFPLIVWIFGCTIIGATIGFPFAYQNYSIQEELSRGRQRADRDWDDGNAGIIEDPPNVVVNGAFVEFSCDAATGLSLMHRRTDNGFSTAYNERIRERIQTEGIPSWSLKDHLVSAEEIVATLDSTELTAVESLPLDVSPSIVLFRNGTISRWGSMMSSGNDTLSIASERHGLVGLGGPGSTVYVGKKKDDLNVVYIRCGTSSAAAFHQDGRLIAVAHR